MCQAVVCTGFCMPVKIISYFLHSLPICGRKQMIVWGVGGGRAGMLCNWVCYLSEICQELVELLWRNMKSSQAMHGFSSSSPPQGDETLLCACHTPTQPHTHCGYTYTCLWCGHDCGPVQLQLEHLLGLDLWNDRLLSTLYKMFCVLLIVTLHLSVVL